MLHHSYSARQVCGSVVCATVGIDDSMCQLMLDEIYTFAQDLVEQSSCHGTKAMRSHHVLGVPHAAQCSVNGVLTHTPVVGSDTREDVFRVPCHWLQFPQNVYSLLRERHQVIVLHFHFGPGNALLGCNEVDLASFRGP